MNYAQAVDALNSIIGLEKKDYMEGTHDGAWFLERTRRFFEALGHPEQKFRYVHIAGSSGKGSTAAMAGEVLHRAGEHVGVYTSPYVTTAIENITIEGKLVDPQVFADAVEVVLVTFEKISNTTPEWRPSYSEVFFAVAIECFTQSDIEIVVLEAGCGGRFDKTNIIPTPEIIILTPLTLDHTELLGNTIKEIAGHKAGIIKPGARVFSTVTQAVAQDVFNKEAKLHNVEITYVVPEKEYETTMPGDHQQTNAAGVDAAMRALEIDEKTIEVGIANARMPARVEEMPQGNAQPHVIIDGAHSPGKIEALKQMLIARDELRTPKVHLIFAAKETKSVEDILSPLTSIIKTATMTSFQLQGFGSHDPADCADTLGRLTSEVEIRIEPDPHTAVDKVMEIANPEDIVLITGSLYLAGILRQRWYPEEKIVEQRTAFPI